jgi:hypothetical protein
LIPSRIPDFRWATPLVSVLIDTFNYKRFIEEAIQSVLSQGFSLRAAQHYA